MARGQKNNLRPVKLHLSLPKEMADWVEDNVNNNPFCHTRQDFIIGTLQQVMEKEVKQGVLELEE